MSLIVLEPKFLPYTMFRKDISMDILLIVYFPDYNKSCHFSPKELWSQLEHKVLLWYDHTYTGVWGVVQNIYFFLSKHLSVQVSLPFLLPMVAMNPYLCPLLTGQDSTSILKGNVRFFRKEELTFFFIVKYHSEFITVKYQENPT